LWGWIGEVLVPGNGGDDPRADAFSLLNKLLRQSFMEANGEVSDEGGLLWFKVHDVMRDLAFYVLENDSGTPLAKTAFIFMEKVKIWKKIPQEWKAISKALTLSLKRNNLKRLPGSFYAPELVSLLLGGWKSNTICTRKFLEQFSKN